MSNILTFDQVRSSYASKDLFASVINRVLDNITTTTTAATTQPYAPITLSGYTAIDFYGDSISIGANLPSASTQRWPAVLCAALGKTERNFSVGGNQWPDNKCYDQSTHTNPSFHAFGMNDHRYQASSVFDQLQRCALNDVLFTTLPTSCIKNVRSGSVTKTGTWVNTLAYSTHGMNSSTVGNTLSASVTGRYVCIGMTSHADTANAVFDIAVDSVSVSRGNIKLEIAITGNGAGYTRHVWVYDTESAASASHNIVYTFHSGSGTVFVDWIGGFNKSQTGCTPNFLMDVYSLDSKNSVTPNSTIGNRYVFKMMYKELARVLRTVLGLPVYFIEDSGSYPLLGSGSLTTISPASDNIHPGPSGHLFVVDRIQAFLQSGEFVQGTTS